MKKYLGDSVYADVLDDYYVVLTTENGLPNEPSNRILLEPQVVAAFARYLAKVRKQQAESKKGIAP